MDPLREVAFGAAAGCLGKLVEFPFDTVKVRLQASVSLRATLATIAHIYRHEGVVGGFYQGVRAPLVGACGESAVLFASYLWAQKMLARAGVEREMVAVAAAGLFAGFAAAFVLTPVELVKCRLQVANVMGPEANVSGRGSATVAPRGSYSAVIQLVVRAHGVRGLWHGLSSTLAREVAGTAVWFSTYEWASAQLKRRRPHHENSNLLLAGAAAGVLFNFLVYPVDTIKSNIQTHAGAPLLVRAAVARVVARPGGARNLYRGLGITLVRSVPANAVIFYTYEWLKQTFGH